MEKSVTMPKLGMTMEEGTVLSWLYKEGDWIKKGEPLVEVMTDKVNMEVESPFNGRLTQILAQEGDVLPVGSPLATLTDDASSDKVQAAPPKQEAGQSPSIKFIANNNAIKDETYSSVQHSSSIAIASTPAAKREAVLQGIDLQTMIEAGAKPPLNRSDVLAYVQSKNAASTPPVRATPLAQKIAREHQVDLRTVAEHKTGAKVTRADIEAHLTNVAAQSATPINGTSTTQTAPISTAAKESELIPLTPVRRLIGQRMLQSITTAPHIYLDTEIDMTGAEQCRKRIGKSLQSKGETPPSITAILIRAVAAALALHPEVNATFAPGALQGKDAIQRWQSIHIGIAVDTEQALLTPAIRNADRLSIPALAQELRRLTLAAREGTLKPDELSGATFTISNLGMYGIDTFHAIIPPGQSAILAVGKVTKRGVVVEENEEARLEIRPVMKVSLSADHRVLDGATGSRFLHQFKTFLEDPYLLL